MADAYLKPDEPLANHRGKAFNFGTDTATSIADVAFFAGIHAANQP